jgi:hypothetical protein
MDSVNHSSFYDPAAMVSLKTAFRGVWEELRAQDTFRVGLSETELKAAIIRRLMELVADGTTNPEELKAQVHPECPLGSSTRRPRGPRP